MGIYGLTYSLYHPEGVSGVVVALSVGDATVTLSVSGELVALPVSGELDVLSASGAPMAFLISGALVVLSVSGAWGFASACANTCDDKSNCAIWLCTKFGGRY